MNEFERRLRDLIDRAKTAFRRRTEGRGDLRHEATVRARRAASRVQDFRESERGKRAAGKLHDLRTSDTGRRAEAALNDLRTSPAGQRAESAIADLRQREAVKKAEENARRVMHDLFSGARGESTETGNAGPTA
jgi:hypothetical protein